MKDYIVHPYDGFNLHIQWNNNIVPKDDEMNVEVLEVMMFLMRLIFLSVKKNLKKELKMVFF